MAGSPESLSDTMLKKDVIEITMPNTISSGHVAMLEAEFCQTEAGDGFMQQYQKTSVSCKRCAGKLGNNLKENITATIIEAVMSLNISCNNCG